MEYLAGGDVMVCIYFSVAPKHVGRSEEATVGHAFVAGIWTKKHAWIQDRTGA